MAKASGIRAGRAFVEIGARLDPLRKGLRGAQMQLVAFGRSVGKIGLGIEIAGTAAALHFAASIRVFQQVGDQIDDMSARTGVSAEALSQLGYAAGLSGSSIDALETGLRVMARTIGEAASGSSAAQETLADLGLSIDRMLAASPEERFTLIAQALSEIPDQSLRSAAAMRIFGKQGTMLLPMIAGGAEGLAAMREEADRLGQTVDGSTAAAAGQLGDAFDRVRLTIRATAVQVGAALAPSLTKLANRIAETVATVVHWVRGNREVIATAAKIVAGVMAVGVAVAAAGTAIVGAGLVLGGLATTIGAIGAAVGLLLSPIGLIVAGVAAATVGLLRFSDAGRRVVRELKSEFAALLEEAGKVMDGISDAIGGGDLKLAIEIALGGMNVAWLAGVDRLRETWYDFTDDFLQSFLQAAETVRVAWQDVTSQVAGAIIENVPEQALTLLQKDRKFMEAFAGSMFDPFGLLYGMKALDDLTGFAGSGRDLAGLTPEQRQEAADLARTGLSGGPQERRDVGGMFDAARNEARGRAFDALYLAQAELESALAEARELRRKAMEDQKRRFGDLTGGDAESPVAEARRRVQSPGTFSAAAAALMNASRGTAERTARAVEQSAQSLRRIERNTSDMEPVFES